MRVLDSFQLPDLRLLCFFDDEDPPCFEQRFKGKYRGFHTPVIGSGYLPQHIHRYLFETGGNHAFDNLIYLRGSTCKSNIGTVITFAHELQHFVQHATAFKVSVANNLFYKNLRDFDPDSAAKAWNIPHEQEAMMVSKRVAEVVLGKDAVGEYITSRIVAEDDPHYWEYFQSLSPHTTFDLCAETIRWVDRYRPKLLGLGQSKVDFSQSEWWR